MEETLLKLHTQFQWQPIVRHAEKIPNAVSKFVLAGMGGSHLAADVLKKMRSSVDFHVHKDYGVPRLRGERPEDHILIASSYSGNTEEVVGFAREARERELSLVIMTSGGKLLEMAEMYDIPHVVLPDGVQPRNALGYMLRGLAAIIDDTQLLKETGALADFNSEELREWGSQIARDIEGKIPVVYASRNNETLAYNWKIKLNETGKSPAFCNVFPELNHNEMEGLSTKQFKEYFHVIFLADSDDHERTKKRMSTTERLYKEKGMYTTWIDIEGHSTLHTIFRTLTLADWTAFQLAHIYGQDPEHVPTIELFKKRIG